MGKLIVAGVVGRDGKWRERVARPRLEAQARAVEACIELANAGYYLRYMAPVTNPANHSVSTSHD